MSNYRNLILSSVFHYEFICLHPFTDGDGKIAQLWQTANLSNWNPILEYISIERQIEMYLDVYYKAIENAILVVHRPSLIHLC